MTKSITKYEAELNKKLVRGIRNLRKMMKCPAGETND
jgi:hypothetical protein